MNYRRTIYKNEKFLNNTFTITNNQINIFINKFQQQVDSTKPQLELRYM